MSCLDHDPLVISGQIPRSALLPVVWCEIAALAPAASSGPGAMPGTGR
jgi:hypothetical protein